MGAPTCDYEPLVHQLTSILLPVVACCSLVSLGYIGAVRCLSNEMPTSGLLLSWLHRAGKKLHSLQSPGYVPYEHSSLSRNTIKKTIPCRVIFIFQCLFRKILKLTQEGNHLPNQTELYRPRTRFTSWFGTLHPPTSSARCLRSRFVRLELKAVAGCVFPVTAFRSVLQQPPYARPSLAFIRGDPGERLAGQESRRPRQGRQRQGSQGSGRPTASQFPSACGLRDLLPGAAHTHHQQHRGCVHFPVLRSPAPASGTGPARPLTSPTTPPLAPVRTAGWCSQRADAGISRCWHSAARRPPGTRGQ